VTRTRSISLIATAVLAIGLALQPAPAHAQNTISTVVGGGPTPTTPLTADLPGPTSAVRDSAGNTYIAAPLSTNIFKLTSGGTLSVFAGQGYGGFNGDGIQASAAVLGRPAAIAFDSKGNIFFADYGATRVRRIDAVTGVITTVAGNGVKCAQPTIAPFCGDGGPATSALLNLPEAIALDGSGNIFIADASDNKIRRVDAVTGIITTVAGNGFACTNPTLPCGDGAGATSAQLNFPEGIAVDAAGNLYVSDTLDQRVRIVSAAGIINPFAGNGGFCHNPTTTCGDGHAATLANLHKPQQVVVDASGNVYIADTLDHKIRVVDTTGTINLFAGLGVQGFGGDGGPATSAELDLPVGVSQDGSGNILIADTGNQRVRIVSSTGVIQTLAGGGSGGDGGAATSALLAGPFTLTGDAAGNLYIADTGNNRIREISGGTITTVAGTGSVGYSGDGTSALSATLNGPTSVVVDSQGNIFFSDTGNLVVRRIDAITHFISTYAGNGNSCFPTTSGCGDGLVATSANLTWPQSIALDSSNNLYIADYFAFKVRKVSAATQIISTVAGTGIEGKAGDGGPANKANLDHPSSVALDGSGNLFISDQYNNKIRKVDAATQIINTYMGTGKACLCGDGGPALSGSMWNPLEVVTDSSGNVFVGGGNDNVVQRINATTGIWGTVAGNAKKPLVGGFAGDGGLASLATLANFGLWVDASNNLYIADEGNNRIRTAHLTPAATLPTQPVNFGNVPLNTASAAKPAKLTSAGGVDLNLTSIAITGANASNFTQTTNCPNPGLLGVDSVCTTNVVFTPTFYGTAKASLTFTDNASNSPQNVSLSGSGPDFSVSNSPNAITVARGSSGSVTTTLKPIAGFNQTISLTCTGAPAGTTCVPNPSSVTLDGVNNGTSLVTVTVGSSTVTGTYTLTVKGAFVPLQHSATITLTVQ
jgi:trimeric autotransporter adhesin